MGLLKAGAGALGGVLADQWREFFYCESMDADVLAIKGEKRIGGRSSNRKGDDNVISNGSIIAVNEGQCMIIVESGKVVEVCAEAGEFVYDTSTEPSVFTGSFGESLKNTFKQIGKRFTFGGDVGKDQRVYYFNTKEIMGNKFGTPNPIMFEVINKRIGMARTVQVRCNGVYSYVISDPLIFYTRICGNVEYMYTRDNLDEQLKAEFIDALQPAFGALAEQELRPAQIPAKSNELKAAMNEALKYEWVENRGISVCKIALNPITLTHEDMKKINELEDAASVGSNPFAMAGMMTNATADAMRTAAANEAGAMTGFMGMGMVGMGGQGGFGAAQNLYNMGVQQQQAQQPPVQQATGWTCVCGQTSNQGKFCINCGKPQPSQDGWTCTCGQLNKGKFCMNCGSPKPAGAPQYKCDKCGWEPEKGSAPPKFCPECGDIFDNNDVK